MWLDLMFSFYPSLILFIGLFGIVSIVIITIYEEELYEENKVAVRNFYDQEDNNSDMYIK